jgi:hypothetical protein
VDEGKTKYKESYKKLSDTKKKKKPEFQVNDFIQPVVEKDDEGYEHETGEYEMTFKMKSVIENRKTGEKTNLKPLLLDSKKNKIPSNVRIGGGSKGAVCFTAHPYYVDAQSMAGITLRLQAVQVKELVSSGGMSPDAFDFDVDEDGFSAEDVEADEDDTSTDEGSEEDDEDDDDF